MSKGISNKRYTPELKKMVVEVMMKEKLSRRETPERFGLSDHHTIPAWEETCLEGRSEDRAAAHPMANTG